MYKKRYHYKYSMEDIGRLVEKKPNTVAKYFQRNKIDPSKLLDVIKYVVEHKPDILLEVNLDSYSVLAIVQKSLIRTKND